MSDPRCDKTLSIIEENDGFTNWLKCFGAIYHTLLIA